MALRHICDGEKSCNKIKSLIEILIRKGADVNAETNDGETVLMAAVSLGNLAAVKTLLSAGADVNRSNSSGETALCVATKENYLDIVALLQSVRARNCKNKKL